MASPNPSESDRDPACPEIDLDRLRAADPHLDALFEVQAERAAQGLPPLGAEEQAAALELYRRFGRLETRTAPVLGLDPADFWNPRRSSPPWFPPPPEAVVGVDFAREVPAPSPPPPGSTPCPCPPWYAPCGAFHVVPPGEILVSGGRRQGAARKLAQLFALASLAVRR